MATAHLYALYHFEDNKGGRASTRFKLPTGLATSGGAGAVAAAIAAALVALCDARLTRYEIIHHSGQLSSPAPAPTSDCFRRVSLLYRDGTGSGSITLPSFVALPFDEDDPYGAGRITRAQLLLWGLLDNVEALVEDTLRPDDTPFPTTFVVGGAAGGLYR